MFNARSNYNTLCFVFVKFSFDNESFIIENFQNAKIAPRRSEIRGAMIVLEFRIPKTQHTQLLHQTQSHSFRDLAVVTEAISRRRIDPH